MTYLSESVDKIRLVRFTDKLNFLLDDIENGFELKPHKIEFETTPFYILKQLIDFWLKTGIQSKHINKVIELEKNSSTIQEFFVKLYELQNKDIQFSIFIKNVIGGCKIEVPIKSFTEIRYNQKIHPIHVGFFGNYGISLSMEWAEKHNATPVIYVKNENEISKRLGVLLGIFKSLMWEKNSIKVIFDLLSVIEHSKNSFEFEWRIIGQHKIIDGSKIKKTPRIKFNLCDIVAIYVNEENEKIVVRNFINDQINKGIHNGAIPKIELVNNIILSENDIKAIEELYRIK